MVKIHSLGFPRIGENRELKFAQEQFWKGAITENELQDIAKKLRQQNWQQQEHCDFIPVGDFSLYDHMLDMSFLLGNVPERVKGAEGTSLDHYFRVARGRSANEQATHCVHAGEMTKWFDTNYHYIVPELSCDTEFQLNATQLLAQISEANDQAHNVKPVIVGPVSYLWLSKEKDQSNRLALLEKLIPVYAQLLHLLSEEGIEWIQIDEPILATELSAEWKHAFEKTYHSLNGANINVLLTTYFGRLEENISLVCNLPVAGIHVDAVNGKNEVSKIIDWLPAHKVLSLGVINGRNIWKTDLTATLDWLIPIAERLQDRLWLAPSCSLLHVPVNLNNEKKLDTEVQSWLAFAVQKLAELEVLKLGLNNGKENVKELLACNEKDINSRKTSKRVHKMAVKESVREINDGLKQRKSSYKNRISSQRAHLKLPLFPTTTIGSFPQTSSIRKTRQAFKRGDITQLTYQQAIQQEIQYSVQQQEILDLDVFVHGEAERNDMVEHFGEQLEGYAFSQFGWVQSYGSRCVKPPILFGDIERKKSMTVAWFEYAQSLTVKPMKGMLTGPVTILNWSFVRDDQPQEETCLQLALAIREEVLDLEAAGASIIQIDEAALREGLPLRESQWQEYLSWSVDAFRLCANGVADETQIHTHMCYSEFNDIIDAIARMDADVITIETSRSDMALLDVFDEYTYPNDIGPGVYDIHSPNIPSEKQIVRLMNAATNKIPLEQLWINPDCGLKTRQWDEVLPALKNMVLAAKVLRSNHEKNVA